MLQLLYQNIEMDLTLKSLSLENFKCFKKEQTLDFQKLTILTGANSSGKSSILYGLLGTLQSGEFPLNYSLNGDYVNMGGFKEISNKHNPKNKISIKVTFNSIADKTDYKISTVWERNKKNNLAQASIISVESKDFLFKIVNDNGYKLSFSYTPPSITTEDQKKSEFAKLLVSQINKIIEFSESRDPSKKLDNDYTASFADKFDKKVDFTGHPIGELEDLPKTIYDLQNSRISYTYSQIIKLFDRFDDNVNFISSQRLEPERTYLEQSKFDSKVTPFGQDYLDQIINWEINDPKKIKELVALLKPFSLVHSIKTKRIPGGRYETLIKPKPKSISSSLSDVGFGISQFLPILIADLQLKENSTLMISQPELHLHPSAQADFGNYLINQINTKKKNYIVETHSEYLLNRIRLSIVKGTLKETDLAVYYIENNGDDVKVHNIKFGKKGEIENAPKNFFDTYFMDVKNIALNSFE